MKNHLKYYGKEIRKKNKRKKVTSDEPQVNEEGLSYNEYIEKQINPDGNCFYRAICYFYRESEEEYYEFRNLTYEYLIYNKKKFIHMIPDEYKGKKDLTYEERMKILENKIDKIRNDKEWAGDLAISALCLMLNLKINLYVKDNYNYKLYFSFEGSSKPNGTIGLLFVNNNNFNVLYKKIIYLNYKIIKKNIIIR